MASVKSVLKIGQRPLVRVTAAREEFFAEVVER
jgi:hypothetical protein